MRAERKESTSCFLDTGPAVAPCSARLVVRKRKSDLKRIAASAAVQAGWNVFLPQQYTYSTDLKDVDPQQLSDLWERTLGEKRSPHRCALAMRKSFAFVLVIVKEHHTETSNWRPSLVNPGTRIVGVARAISDGEFMATVCDVAVDPDYTGRGIGRKVVQTLVRNMKLRGPTGFAAFPPPKARRFFFMLGFRIDKKYRLMSYEGKGEFPDLRDEQAKLKGARRESQGLIGKVTGSQPGFDSNTSIAPEGVAETGE
ncbi:acetyltransferase NSI [Klebsormidium nitens]|uniref:Acetyltransferase NSI n=1 Tax=Klebsormidium nitens TaxID=105231 RepID=A0A1Y1IES0_KLENI|nr:acetyltransferase NSI [Klebsormidium nitens]|eukprot:GAQ86608.1 acetyltransferase NSI [Klebsormidium nitens]